MNEITRKRVDAGALFSGLTLIAIGILFLLDRLRIVRFGWLVGHYWPVFVAAFAVRSLLRGRIWNGLWFLAVAAWLQISVLHLFGMSFASSWPLLLIAYGLGMIIRAAADSAKRREPRAPEDRHGA
jgi:LiaF transmembrane domain